jgi:hypothetical protein
MVAAVATDRSRQKQVIYTRYAVGEITISEVADQIAAIAPPKRRTPGYLVAKFAFFVLTALLLPSWVNRGERG